MTPTELIKLGAGLQRMADRLEHGHVWYHLPYGVYTDKDGITWELTDIGWQAVIS